MTTSIGARPTSIEAALERLEQAQDSLLGLGNLSESLFNFTTLREDDGTGLPHAGTPWGVKASQGQRPNMEDAYSVQMPQQVGPAHPGNAQQVPVLTAQSPPHQDARVTHGEVASVASPIPQDAIVAPPIPEDLAVLSVFDGHGGTEVAEHCRDRLHKHFAASLSHQRTAAATGQPGKGQEEADESDGSPSGTDCSDTTLASTPNLDRNNLACTSQHVTDALRTAFHKTDTELAGTDAGEYVGATAVVAVVGRQHIWIAHCGDSRAVIQRSGEAVALTRDHKPDREDEAARIKAVGGRIVFTSGSHRVMGMLAMSRAIGDHFLRPYVIAEPEVSCVERTSQDEVLVLATDGLWDVFSCKEATTLAQRCITRSKERGMSRHGACRVAASVLTKVALERGSRDNITVIVVDVSIAASTQQQQHTAALQTGTSVQQHLHTGTASRSSSTAAAASGGGAGAGVGTAASGWVRGGGYSEAKASVGGAEGAASGKGAHTAAAAGLRLPQVGSAADMESCAHSCVPCGNSCSASGNAFGGSGAPASAPLASASGDSSSKLCLLSAESGASQGGGSGAPVQTGTGHAAGGVTPQGGTSGGAAEEQRPTSEQHSQQQQQRPADGELDGAVAGGSAGSKGGAGGGMGSRTQSFSVTTCTWVKSGGTLAGSLGPAGGSTSSLERKLENDRSMERQISAPSSRQLPISTAEQQPGGQAEAAPTRQPSGPDSRSHLHLPVSGGGSVASSATKSTAELPTPLLIPSCISPTSHAQHPHQHQQHKSGQQSPHSPKSNPVVPHRLAHGTSAPPPSAVIRALQAEQQQQHGRSLPPVAPAGGSGVRSTSNPAAAASAEVGEGADGTAPAFPLQAPGSIGQQYVRNSSESGAPHNAVSAARRGRVMVKRPGSGEAQRKLTSHDCLQTVAAAALATVDSDSDGLAVLSKSQESSGPASAPSLDGSVRASQTL